MKRFGLIGNNISHSGSPELFRRRYDGKWPYELIEGADFQVLWKRFLQDYEGVNITAPFKEKAFAQVAALTADGMGSLSVAALKAGAINLAVKIDGIIHGDNTDFSAVVLGVAEAFYPGIVNEFSATFGLDLVKKVHQFFRLRFSELYPDGAQALIIGCGGAGRAAAVAAAELGYDVVLTNRTLSKAADLAANLPEYRMAVCTPGDLSPAVAASDLIIYAASAPIEGLNLLSGNDFTIEGPGKKARKIVMEANYKAPSIAGPLLDAISGAGALYISGLDWLRLQALAGFPLLVQER